MDAFAAGDLFLVSQARLLERRLFATCFLGQPAERVTDALRGYQNDDGGFAQALEPDTRCPASLPIYVEVAFQALATAGAEDREMVLRACDFLAATAAAAGAAGAVPLCLPVIESFPRAEHMTEWTYVPGLNPTAGLAGLLYQLAVDHPWRADATAWCFRELETDGLPTDAHAFWETLIFLEHVSDQERAGAIAAGLPAHLPKVTMLHLDPDATGYGLSPVQLAPRPESRWRGLFTDERIRAHLTKLEQAQQPDGGWPISWEPPSAAAALEWRGVVTFQALRSLTAYGRLSAGT